MQKRTKRRIDDDFDVSDKGQATPEPVGPDPFSCYLKGQISGLAPVQLYFNFLRPKSEIMEAPDKGRLTITFVLGGVALAERPIHIEWLTERSAIFLLEKAQEAGWDYIGKGGLLGFNAQPIRHVQVDPNTFIAALFQNWMEKQSKDPRFEAFRHDGHALAS